MAKRRSRRIGIDGLLRYIGGTLKVQAVAVGVSERCDPEIVAHEWSRRVEASCFRIVIHGNGVRTHETDAHSLAQKPYRPPTRLPILPVLLKHNGDAIPFQPTPSESATRIPLSRDRETEPVYIKSQRCLDVLDVEEGHRLPKIWSAGGLSFHCRIEECLTSHLNLRCLTVQLPRLFRNLFDCVYHERRLLQLNEVSSLFDNNVFAAGNRCQPFLVFLDPHFFALCGHGCIFGCS